MIYVSFFVFYTYILWRCNCVSSRCTCWFNTFIYCNMITNIVLVNMYNTSHNYPLFLVVRTFIIWSLNNFEAYNTVLLGTITIAYFTSPEVIHLLTGSLYPLTNSSSLPHLPPFPPALVTTTGLSVSEWSFLDCTYKWYHTVLNLSLSYLT